MPTGRSGGAPAEQPAGRGDREGQDAPHQPSAEFIAAGVFDVHDDPDDELTFGLERILDGLDALVQARS